MFGVARRVDTDIECQIAVGFPGAESREEMLERRGDGAVGCIGDSICMTPIFDCSPARRRALGAAIVLEFQAEPDMVYESPTAVGHGTKINDTSWRQSESTKIVPLDLCLPLSRHCSQATQSAGAVVFHQNLEDEKPDLSGQAVPMCCLSRSIAGCD
jgi:hypothetical protein